MGVTRAERRAKQVRGAFDLLLELDDGTVLSKLLQRTLLPDVPWNGKDYLSDLGAAQAFANAVLPAFWVTSGLCYLSGHASLGPDYNGPEGERLFREWPIADCDGGWHEDLEPGEGVADVSHQCAAILRCVVKAVAYREGTPIVEDDRKAP